MFLSIYAIGPLHLIANNQIADDSLNNIGSNLCKEQSDFTEWLDSKESDFVVYKNFGSIAVLTPQKMLEFAWVQANSEKALLWIIRSHTDGGVSSIFPPEFLAETIGVFNNLTFEKVSCRVPFICLPFFS